MASPPASTKTSLGQRLRERARQRWPQLAGIGVRFRGQFAYVTGQLPDGSELPLCRLRYVGYASTWGFAIYRASHDDYQDNYLPSGQPSGTPEEALDCACGLYLGDPTAWLTPPGTDTPTDLQAGVLVPWPPPPSSLFPVRALSSSRRSAPRVPCSERRRFPPMRRSRPLRRFPWKSRDRTRIAGAGSSPRCGMMAG